MASSDALPIPGATVSTKVSQRPLPSPLIHKQFDSVGKKAGESAATGITPSDRFTNGGRTGIRSNDDVFENRRPQPVNINVNVKVDITINNGSGNNSNNSGTTTIDSNNGNRNDSRRILSP
jgi:hypothetical protein